MDYAIAMSDGSPFPVDDLKRDIPQQWPGATFAEPAPAFASMSLGEFHLPADDEGFDADVTLIGNGGMLSVETRSTERAAEFFAWVSQQAWYPEEDGAVVIGDWFPQGVVPLPASTTAEFLMVGLV